MRGSWRWCLPMLGVVMLITAGASVATAGGRTVGRAGSAATPALSVAVREFGTGQIPGLVAPGRTASRQSQLDALLAHLLHQPITGRPQLLAPLPGLGTPGRPRVIGPRTDTTGHTCLIAADAGSGCPSTRARAAQGFVDDGVVVGTSVAPR